MENDIENKTNHLEENVTTAENRPSAEDILTHIKTPKIRGNSVDKPIINVSKTGMIRFAKGLLFDMGFPTTVAFSFSKNRVFCIPDPTVKGVIPYELKKPSGSNLHGFTQNKDLTVDLQLSFDKVGEDMVLKGVKFMKIKNDMVWEIKLNKIIT